MKIFLLEGIHPKSKTLNVDSSFFMNSLQVFPFHCFTHKNGRVSKEEGKLSHLFIHLPELLSMAIIFFHYLKGLFPISACRQAQATSIVPSHLALNSSVNPVGSYSMRNKVRSFSKFIQIVLI